MSRRRVLLLMKPLDVYPPRSAATRSSDLPSSSSSSSASPSTSSSSRIVSQKVLDYLDDRCRVHKNTIRFCQDILERKPLDWMPILRNNLQHQIRDVDLVITVGGDGTLLKASHFLDDTVPVLGVNSDPTQVEEVDRLYDEFDATRSTGYLCAASAKTFEQVLDDILEGHRHPSPLSRMAINLNGYQIPKYALNDILVAHPCPATVSRFSFSVKGNGHKSSSLVNCRSSGLRVSTAAGSTAAMLSAGGHPMPILSRDLQYIVREPILPRPGETLMMNGYIRSDQALNLSWYTQGGFIYVDGSHVTYSVQHGDTITVSNKAPRLQVYLDETLTRESRD